MEVSVGGAGLVIDFRIHAETESLAILAATKVEAVQNAK